MRMRTGIVTVLSWALLAGGCGTQAPGDGEQAAVEKPVWPRQPQEPRIRYERSVSRPRDFGIVPSFFARAIALFSGDDTGHFVRPTGVAERAGVLYVADPGARALWILDTAENRFESVHNAGEMALDSPVALAVRPDGAVFLADSGLKKVLLFDRQGRFIRIVADEGLARPAGLAYDAAGKRLYVSDSANHRITAYDGRGGLVRSWGRQGTGDGEFNYPTYLAWGEAGTLLVTDALNFRIQAFDLDGRFLWKLGHHGDGSGDFAAPKGLAVDGEGHVYVVDALFDAVQIFQRDGALLLSFGERGTRPGQFWLPGGIFIDAHDRIYVADAYNQRVQVFLGPAPAKEAKK
jgi:DNA-binding beta-propeller fold protein YncE